MKLKAAHIALAALLLLLLLPACGRRGRIIPAGKMAEIYVDMFLADQWVSDNYGTRKTADTSDFYGPIFKAHGYNVQDYDRSVSHYLENPDNYSRMLDKSAEILEKRIKALKTEDERREKVKELERYLRDNLLPRVNFEQDDSLLWRPDTLAATADSLAVAADSLMVAVDSLAATDSLVATADSLVIAADSVVAVPETPQLHPLKIDTVKHAKGRDRFRTNSLKEARQLSRD